MDKLTDISVIKKLMARHNFTFSKSLGQNFLVNPTVCPRMAEAVCEGGGVIEIGPGFGVLTNELCKRTERVAAIELDRRLLPVLSETLSEFDNAEIINADVLKTDLRALIEEKFGQMPVNIAGNLPYYITSPIIMGILEQRLPVGCMVAMVQKEAAERICARPGARECGAVSAAVWYYSEPEILFRVSRGSFMPPPKVDSAVIRLNIRKSPPVVIKNEKAFFSLIKSGFSQRRKTLANSIANTTGRKKEEIYAAMGKSGIDKNARAEQLSLEDWARLTETL